MRRGIASWVVALFIASGCAGEGCSCMAPLENGFPADERQSNAVQARLSGTGLEFLTDNLPLLEDQLFPEGLSFPVPPSCGADPRVCCYVPYGYCRLDLDIDPKPLDLPRLEIEPIADDRLGLTIRARVRTPVSMPVHQKGLFGDIQCQVSINSAWSGDPSISMYLELALADDPLTGETRADVVGSQVWGLSGDDVDIAGGLLCGFASEADAASRMMSQFRQELPGVIDDFLCKECAGDGDCAPLGTCAGDGVCIVGSDAGQRCMQSFGISGRMDAVAVLGSLPSDAAGAIDLYLAAGGFARSVAGGVSLGALTGALPAGPVDRHDCVPASAEPPASDVAQSTVLRGNTHPTSGQPFDLGIGVSRAFLERAAWAAHQAGFLCLDVGAERVPLLQAGSLAVLAPSLIDLVTDDDAPLFLLVRPQQPPSIALGAGTLTDGGGGQVEVDEPLLEIHLPELEIDLYLLIDQRYVRILTMRGDLRLPLALDVDGDGRIVPVLGDVAEAFENLTVANSEILAESPEAIAARFPALLSVALPALADGLGGFDVPAFSGMTLDLGPGSFTAIEGDSILGIFGDLAAGAAAVRTARTRAAITAIDGPGAAVELALGGESASGAALEWQVRLDGGFWSPYSQSPRLRLQRQALWLQGGHRIEVRAREIGVPRTTDPQPVVIDLLIDALPVVEEDDQAGFHGSAGNGGCECQSGGGSAGGLLVVLACALILWRPRRTAVVAALLVMIGCGGDSGGQPDVDAGAAEPTVVVPGPTGRWASMAAEGQRTVVAAYEQDFGDLVVAEVTGEGAPPFTVIQGAPDGPVVLDPTGYRGGVTAAGDDVGAWTSIALHDGVAAVAYQHRDRGALHLARETDAGWVTHEIDRPEAGEVGLYASLSLDAAGVPGIAYMARIPADPDPDGHPQITAELRWAQAAGPAPDGPDSWTIEVIDQVTVPAEPAFADLPTGTGAFACAVRLPGDIPAVAYYDQQAGDLRLALRAPEGWQVRPLDGGPAVDRGQWASAAVAADGTLWVAYQDAISDRLLLRSFAGDVPGERIVLDDGRRPGDRPHSVGASARLRLDDVGPQVFYQDATVADLYAVRPGETPTPVLSGPVAYGFYIATAGPWLFTYTYDANHYPPGKGTVSGF